MADVKQAPWWQQQSFVDDDGHLWIWRDPIYYKAEPFTGGTMSKEEEYEYDTPEKDIVLETFNELEDEIDNVDDADFLERELEEEEEINHRLRAELAAEKGVDRTATEIKRDWLGRPKVDETTYKNHLDLPVEEKVFTVHGKNFHSYNEALQFEVLTDLKNKTFAFDRYGFEYHAIEAEDNKTDSVESLGEFCIPLDCLAQNIDEISLILREYQQKKQR
jgi:hypothetical protein